jgi:integrase/recombinase XerD
MNLSSLINGFNNRMRLAEMSPSTIGGYIRETKEALTKFNRDPKTITVEDWIQYFCGLKVHKRKTAIAAMKRFYTDMYNSTKLSKLHYPDLPEHLPDPLAKEEVKKLIEAAINIKHKTILMCLYTSGLRSSELIALKWPHIERANERIQVKQGKGKKDRSAPLTPSMIKQFEQYCKEYKLTCFNSTGYVFTGKSKTKEGYSKRSIAQLIDKYSLIAGIKRKITPHTLRHSFATHMKEDGVDILQIKEWLGHESLETTAIYTKLAKRVVPDLMQ